MPVHNSEIAGIFGACADLLEIEGANQYRVRAYRNAARGITGLPRSAASMLEAGEDLSSLPGIGKDLAGKIEEIIRTGRLAGLEEIKKKVPAGLTEVMKIGGLGPKRAGKLFHELGVSGLADLRKAGEEGKIRELEGFGAKTEEAVVSELKRKGAAGAQGGRLLLAGAEDFALPLLEYLRKGKGVRRAEAAGSYRRGVETVGDLDILVTHDEGSGVMDRFAGYDEVEKVVAKGGTRSTVVLRSGLQVDLRAVAGESYGAALHYFTGSKAHNIAVRRMGVKRGLKINEYGVFRGKKRVAGRTEEEVYSSVKLPYIEPELRENNGELEAAAKGKLPKLVALEDIRGDLHCHTDATDGRSTLVEMAEAAKKKGYEYLAVTDHTRRLAMAHGFDARRLERRLGEIDRLNGRLKGVRILKSAEVDILEDGSLDLPDAVLKKLDLLVCAVHYKFRLSAKEQTERIVRAMNSPFFCVIAHPTGRLIGERDRYEVDMERVVREAKATGSALEINARPQRLDLDDAHCRMAAEAGVRLAISTDAHSSVELDFMRHGVVQGRRGWLEAKDVLNTLTLKRLLEAVKK
ncbi:MAG: DNA polymerase/3'-5' exonuclease PolX [Elusimicrobiales bacterium]|nr:DNA polymerase/3'-5' exonuclease PolX [Elusimicrobiales bacterium]